MLKRTALFLANRRDPLRAIFARAQNSNTGEIKGSVMDPSGAVVPGAAVSIKNVQTGVVTATTTNQSGLYDVPFLSPGNYTITFSKEGFRSSSAKASFSRSKRWRLAARCKSAPPPRKSW
jgi:hypothetical protein